MIKIFSITNENGDGKKELFSVDKAGHHLNWMMAATGKQNAGTWKVHFVGKKNNIVLPEEIKEPVVLKKNDRVALPDNIKQVMICLGWKCKGGADVDASIVPLDGDR